MNTNVLWLVCGQTCRDLRKKSFECANLKTLKMHGELGAYVVSCETAFSHRCQCLMLTRRYKRMIKSDVGQEKSSETNIVEEQRTFSEVTQALRRVRNSRDEKTDDAGTVATRTNRSDFLRVGNSAIPPSLKMHVSQEKSERWSWLEKETTRRTQRP